jgi:hypothetical protein
MLWFESCLLIRKSHQLVPKRAESARLSRRWRRGQRLEIDHKEIARRNTQLESDKFGYRDREKRATQRRILPAIRRAGGETPPIELIRQSQRPSALRLFVDLYHAQGLARDGGVHWRQLRRVYERHKVGERGIYVIWGFREVTTEAWGTAFFVAPHLTGQTEMVKQLDGTVKHEDPGWPEFWQALQILTSTGLVDFVGHVVDADTAAGNVLHPYAIGNGEEAERTIAHFAHLAGQAMVTDGQRSWAEENGLHLLPVPKHVEQVQLVGLARLKYRARTTATAAGFGSAEEWASWARS